MIYRVGITQVGSNQAISDAVPISIPTAYYRWRVDLSHRSGGLKKRWFLGQEGCPITSVSFEQNKGGCGSGTIEFAYIDFPIDAEDKIEVFYYDTQKYVGIVDTKPDIKGGEAELIPQHTRFKELLYNGSFTTKTVTEILSTIIQAVDDDSGIFWNAALIDTGSTATFTIEYSYETIEKILDDLMERLDSRYWGVNEAGFFYVKELESTLDERLLYVNSPAYSDIDIETDYSGIKATRYQVFKKSSGTSETTRIGQVGYDAVGGSYPTLSVEKVFRKIEDKLTVSEVLSDAEALDYAYGKLQSQEIIESITVKDVDLDKYEPEIGKLVSVQAPEAEILRTILACDSTTGWTGATLDTDDYVEGTGSLYCTIVDIGNGMEYNFGTGMKYKEVQRIGFMLKSDVSGSFLQFLSYFGTILELDTASAGICSMGDCCGGDQDITEINTYEVIQNRLVIPASGVWLYFDFTGYAGLYKIRFDCWDTPSGTAKVNIDRINLFQTYRKEYEDNIVQINYKIEPNNEYVEMKLQNYDPKANDAFFALDTKVQILEAVAAAS